MSYDDTKSMGRSRITPFIPGEDPQTRHARRLLTAQESQDYVAAWCRAHDCNLTVSNEGHHWRVTGRLTAEWWPSSAKLVLDRKYDRGIHCHDYEQLIKVLERRLG